jgi:hypothetical protein
MRRQGNLHHRERLRASDDVLTADGKVYDTAPKRLHELRSPIHRLRAEREPCVVH